MRLAESGLVNYWVKRITPKNKKCEAENLKAFSNDNDGHQRKILSLNDLSGPFILIFSGLVFSLSLFLGERLYYHVKHTDNFKAPLIVESREMDRVEAIDQQSVNYPHQEPLLVTSVNDFQIEEGVDQEIQVMETNI